MNPEYVYDASKTQPSAIEKNYFTRNSTSRLKREYRPCRKFNIQPLKLDKELTEILNEPLPEFNLRFDDSEDSQRNEENEEEGGNDKESEEIKEEEPRVKQLVESDNNAVHDSFDLDFGMLSLQTPIKSSKSLDNKHNMVPQSSSKKSLEGSIFTAEALKKSDFVTPKVNKIPPNPKIQCSVDVKSYLANSVGPKNFHQQLLSKPRNSFATPKIGNTSQNARNALTDNRIENAKNKIQVTIPTKNLFEKDIFQKVVVNDVEYIILKLLGRGGSSQVFHCYDLESKNNRAIKCVSLNNPESAAGYINEAKLLQKLQKCDRIIKMYDFEIRESEKQLYVVLEMGGADLARILKELASNTTHVPLYVLIFYWMEMLYAVKQIHSNGIIHSDLKPANFLKAESGLKLIDFGIATCIQSDMTSVLKTVPEGSFNYISPEAVMNESNSPSSLKTSKPRYKISYKSDVWSLGCILYQLVYRRTPFQHISNMWRKLATVGDPNHVIEYPEVDWVPIRIINTIKQCLQYEMKARPSIDELIAEYENIFNDMR